METLNTLLNIDSNYIVIGLFVFFFTLEQILNTPFKFDKRSRYFLHNFLLGVLFVALSYFFSIFLVFSVEWLNDHHMGMLYLFETPIWLKLLLGIIFYDLTAYWVHRTIHKVPVLWRFHRIHHSDTSVDSSTFFRFHSLELLLAFAMGDILTTAIIGTNLFSLLFYYLILNLFLFLEHSNLNYPIWLDKTLGWIITTPNLHKVHHEQNQFYTDSNYANIFILWDRLFGTYKYLPVKDIKYGLKEFDDDKKQTFPYLIRSPFINIKGVASKSVTSNQDERVKQLSG